jgi:hypothetical protein
MVVPTLDLKVWIVGYAVLINGISDITKKKLIENLQQVPEASAPLQTGRMHLACGRLCAASLTERLALFCSFRNSARKVYVNQRLGKNWRKACGKAKCLWLLRKCWPASKIFHWYIWEKMLSKL